MTEEAIASPSSSVLGLGSGEEPAAKDANGEEPSNDRAAVTEQQEEEEEEPAKDANGEEPMNDLAAVIEQNDSMPALDHEWEKGDHLIRWEMLPIAYPIQVHAIVLEANEEYVKLVDFGLTAVPNRDEDQEKTEQEQKKKFDVLHKYLVKPLQPSNKKKKERLIIRVLTDQKDIKPWSKVNYNGGFLGIGGKKSKGTDAGESGKKSWYNKMNVFAKKSPVSADDVATTATEEGSIATKEGEDVIAKTPSNEHTEGGGTRDTNSNTGTKERENAIDTGTKSWYKMNMNMNMFGKKSTTDEPVKELGLSTPNGKASEGSQSDFLEKAVQNAKAKNWFEKQAENMNQSMKASWKGTKTLTRNSITATKTITKNSIQSIETAFSIKPKEVDVESGETGDGTSPTAKQPSPKFMNPAMAKLMEDNKSSKGSSSLSFSSFSPSKKREGRPKKPKAPKLPKDDPTALVLARVDFLLEHGEDILPSYNVFSSNSETIAVWCKTGHFRTIQADVFLHSTAIGNGKSAGVIAAGLAATSVGAAVGVAGIGVAAAIAPWWYLKHSKDKSKGGTQTLNDAFWGSVHATPTVFVACIEQWGQQANTKEAKEILDADHHQVEQTKSVEEEETKEDNNI